MNKVLSTAVAMSFAYAATADAATFRLVYDNAASATPWLDVTVEATEQTTGIFAIDDILSASVPGLVSGTYTTAGTFAVSTYYNSGGVDFGTATFAADGSAVDAAFCFSPFVVADACASGNIVYRELINVAVPPAITGNRFFGDTASTSSFAEVLAPDRFNVTLISADPDPIPGPTPDPVASVPLPATAWLFLGGLGVLAATRRKQNS